MAAKRKLPSLRGVVSASFLDGAGGGSDGGPVDGVVLGHKTVPLMDLVFCRISASRSACASPSSPERYAGPMERMTWVLLGEAVEVFEDCTASL